MALMSVIRERGHGTRVSLFFTTMRENVAELPGVAQFAAEAGIGELYVQRLVYFGKGLAVEEQSLYRKLAGQEQGALAETARICRQHNIKLAASGGEQVTPEGS